ncbi:hypothetical protein [Halorussus pelagicus]|uniref:hypothetical protein n=1 Tax=Halorussus pelagicus TaxID=2505977 RepID=UPI000FFCA856|nr:hypothetical protein [Halorussus pelagicus]
MPRPPVRRGGGSRDDDSSSDETESDDSETVGNDGPGGTAPTQGELTGGLGSDSGSESDSGSSDSSDSNSGSSGASGSGSAGDGFDKDMANEARYGDDSPNDTTPEDDTDTSSRSGEKYSEEVMPAERPTVVTDDGAPDLSRDTVQETVSEVQRNVASEYGSEVSPSDVRVRVTGENVVEVLGLSRGAQRDVLEDRLKEQTGAEDVEFSKEDGDLTARPIFGDQPERIDGPRGGPDLTNDQSDVGEEFSLGPPRNADEKRRVGSGGQLGEELMEKQVEDDSDVNVDVGRDEQGGFVLDRTETTTNIRERIAEETENIDESDIKRVFRKGPDSVEDLAADKEAETGYGVELTREARKTLLRQKAREQNPNAENIEVVENEKGDLVAQIEGQQAEEQFGDYQAEIPFTGGETVEDYLEGGSQAISSAIQDTSSALFDEGGIASESIIAEELEDTANDLRARGYDDAASSLEGTSVALEESLRSFGKGTFEGAANIANVPRAALGLKEGAEYLVYAGSETLAGDGDEVAEQTDDALVSAGAAAVDAAQSNPAEFSGQLVGSLGGSAAAISGASKLSSTAGRAAAYGIQPGEELVGSVATRLASKTATGSRVVSQMPGNKLGPEELSVVAGKKAGQKLRETVDDPRVRQFLRDERRQAQPLGPGTGAGDQLTLTRDREESNSETTESDEELSDLDKELEELREKVSEQDVRETDEWTPESAEVSEAEPGATPTEDLRELTPDDQSVEEVAESTPTTDVRETSETDLESEIGVKPGSQSKSLDQTIREIDELNQGLRQQFELQDAQKTTAETEKTTEVGVEARTVEEEEAATTLRDLQEEVQRDLDSTFEDTASRLREAQATDQGVTVESSVDLSTEMDQTLDLDFEQDLDQDLQLDQEFNQDFERDLDLRKKFDRRKKELPGGDQPRSDFWQEFEEIGGLFSKEYRNPVASLDEMDAEFDAAFEEGFE